MKRVSVWTCGLCQEWCGEQLLQRLIAATGGDVTFEVMGTADPVYTDPADPWIVEVAELTKSVTGEAAPISFANYFTDAAALKPAMGNPPTVILGPGEPHMLHQTDEYCVINRIEQAEAIFSGIIKRWCGV